MTLEQTVRDEPERGLFVSLSGRSETSIHDVRARRTRHTSVSDVVHCWRGSCVGHDANKHGPSARPLDDEVPAARLDVRAFHSRERSENPTVRNGQSTTTLINHARQRVAERGELNNLRIDLGEMLPRQTVHIAA